MWKSFWGQIAGCAGLLIISLLLPLTAGAATFTVSNLADSGVGSLRQAMTDANAANGNTQVVEFSSGLAGTVSLFSELPAIEKPLFALRAPMPDQIVIDFGGVPGLLVAQSQAGFVTISNLTFLRGRRDWGGCLNNEVGAILQIFSSSFRECQAIGRSKPLNAALGGGLFSANDTRIEDTEFVNNQAVSQTGSAGGAGAYLGFFIAEGDHRIERTEFSTNEAVALGATGQASSHALLVQGSNLSRDTSVTQSVFLDHPLGNAVSINSDRSSVEGAVFAGNAGATLNVNSDQARLQNNLFWGNGSERTNEGLLSTFSGRAFVDSADLAMRHNTFIDNFGSLTSAADLVLAADTVISAFSHNVFVGTVNGISCVVDDQAPSLATASHNYFAEGTCEGAQTSGTVAATLRYNRSPRTVPGVLISIPTPFSESAVLFGGRSDGASGSDYQQCALVDISGELRGAVPCAAGATEFRHSVADELFNTGFEARSGPQARS